MQPAANRYSHACLMILCVDDCTHFQVEVVYLTAPTSHHSLRTCSENIKCAKHCSLLFPSAIQSLWQPDTVDITHTAIKTIWETESLRGFEYFPESFH